jgi:two-component system, NarL family, sensor histidine kinase LiaS
MKIFRQLRWKLTLSYIIVTVSSFLVILLIMSGLIFTQIFIPENVLTLEGLIELVQKDTVPGWSRILEETAYDPKLINIILESAISAQFTSRNFLTLGVVQFWVSTVAEVRILIIGTDGILLGRSDPRFLPSIKLGEYFDSARVLGLEAPFNAALDGETDPKRLYSASPKVGVLERYDRYNIAVPIFSNGFGDKKQVAGVMVILLDRFPTQKDIPAHILRVAGRSLIIFPLGAGIMGAIFGVVFTHGLDKRLKRISKATDDWSEGNFSLLIDDNKGDEISQIAKRLNSMAEQLIVLLRRRQEMAVSEERNRLARDLHDSAKQQALAASLELGTALTLYERDPKEARKHLVEADALVDAVRKELTNLVHELRPQAMDGEDFSDILREYATEWAQRSGIELSFSIEGESNLPLEIRETLFRIAQEALANIARHSAARSSEVSLEHGSDGIRMVVKDDGRGFDPSASFRGVGLVSMRERTERLGGSLSVESAPGRGTKIVVNLPAKD